MKQSLRKIHSIVILCSCCILCSYSSDTTGYYNHNIVSPQVENMIRYGDVSTSLFFGRMNFSIPIYSLKDPDFNLDIALHYNSEGFKPCESSGFVGYHWFLQAGGCVTREVRGLPDETTRINNTLHVLERGIIPLTRDTIVDKNKIFSLDPNIVINKRNLGDIYNISMKNKFTGEELYVDGMPDIFHFNFLGYHGTFIVNNQGEVRVLSGDYVQVNLSKIIDGEPNFRTEDFNSNVPHDNFGIRNPLPLTTSEITITTNDGYTYVFGGELAALGYSVSADKEGEFIKQDPPFINAWYLTRVEAPNGRIMLFRYANPYWGMSRESVSEEFMVFSQHYDLFSLYNNRLFPDGKGYEKQRMEYETTYHVRHCYTKECILESISIWDKERNNSFRIEFIKSYEEKKMYNHAQYSKNLSRLNNYQLKGIVVKSDSVIRNVNLDYVYASRREGVASNSINWRFLSSVSISGVGTYKLRYNSVDPNNSNAISFPNIAEELRTNNDYGAKTSLDFWKENPYLGQLTEVIFPTGGSQKYTYLQHQPNTERHFQKVLSVNNTILEWISESIEPQRRGGCYISTIETYEGNSLTEKKMYTYENGIYYNTLHMHSKGNHRTVEPFRLRDVYSAFDSHIGYPQVIETIQNGKKETIGRNVYTFDSGPDFYSSLDPSINIGKAVGESCTPSYLCALAYNGRYLNPNGKLIQLDYYKGNQKIKSRNWTYNGISSSGNNLIPYGMEDVGCTDTIVVLPDVDISPVARKLYVYPDVLSQETETEYLPDGHSCFTTKIYNHDAKLRIKQINTTDSRGITHYTKYTYPDNVKGCAAGTAYQMLVEANRIQRPVEIVSGFIDKGTEYVTEGEIELYTNNSPLQSYSHKSPSIRPDWDHHLADTFNINPDLLIDKTEAYPSLSSTRKLAITGPMPLASYQWLEMDKYEYSFDHSYILTANYKFDKMNRLTSIKPFGQIETKYTWNGIYPTSKTIGNQTWKYSFIPYVGVNQITDPRGITTYYTYDEAGRLIEEYQMIDGEKQILNIYQYHIKTE